METQEEVGIDVFVARQPIFRADQTIMGYELLYRGDGEVDEAPEGNASGMSSTVLVNALLAIGLQEITSGQTAFINFPKEFILDRMAEVLDPEEVVIELHESIEPEPRVLEACRRLRERGFVLALDDFEFHDDYGPLLEVARVVKVEVLERSREELERMVDRLAPYGVQLLAEKVETGEMHEMCLDLGFELFQGFHYLRPETLSRHDLSTESVAVIRLINLITDLETTDRTIEEAFRSDPGLSYKLLRMVNSASLGGRGINSIDHALRLLGREPLHRWLSMLLVADARNGNGIRSELVKSSLFRGHLCELVGDQVGGTARRSIPSPGTLFLIGLFSRIDVLLKIPMEDLFKKIDLSEAARDALLWRAGPGGGILKGVEAYEAARWEDAEVELEAVGLDPTELPNLYLESIAWASDRMSAHRGD
jgi:EAL and modified HD-GYP domain-containing signal transduction protein